MRVCGCEDMRVCGCEDKRVCGCEVMRVCGCEGVRVCGCSRMRNLVSKHVRVRAAPTAMHTRMWQQRAASLKPGGVRATPVASRGLSAGRAQGRRREPRVSQDLLCLHPDAPPPMMTKPCMAGTGGGQGRRAWATGAVQVRSNQGAYHGHSGCRLPHCVAVLVVLVTVWLFSSVCPRQCAGPGLFCCSLPAACFCLVCVRQGPLQRVARTGACQRACARWAAKLRARQTSRPPNLAPWLKLLPLQDANFVKDVLKELPGVDASDPRILSMLDKIKDKRPPTASYSSSLSVGAGGYGPALASSLAAVSISPLSSSVSNR